MRGVGHDGEGVGKDAAHHLHYHEDESDDQRYYQLALRLRQQKGLRSAPVSPQRKHGRGRRPPAATRPRTFLYSIAFSAEAPPAREHALMPRGKAAAGGEATQQPIALPSPCLISSSLSSQSHHGPALTALVDGAVPRGGHPQAGARPIIQEQGRGGALCPRVGGVHRAGCRQVAAAVGQCEKKGWQGIRTVFCLKVTNW